MKDLLKNAFPLYEKVASALKNLKMDENIEKKLVFTSRNIFPSLKIDFPQVSTKLPLTEKTRNKTILFPVDKKLFSTSRNEGLAKKYVPVEEKSASTGSS